MATASGVNQVARATIEAKKYSAPFWRIFSNGMNGSEPAQVFRIAYKPASSNVRPCVFDEPPCRAAESDDVTQMARFVLEAVLPPRSRLRFVPADSWAFADIARPHTDNSSVMGMVFNGLAEFTQPDMFLTPERVGLMPSLGRLRASRHIVVYKERDLSRRTGLDFAAVTNQGFYVSVALAAVVLRLVAVLYAKAVRVTATERTLGYFRRAYRRNGVIVGVLLTFFLRFLSSDIILILNKLTPPQPLFDSLWDVVTALEAGDFQALVTYPVTFDYFFRHGENLPGASLSARLHRAALASPPRRLFDAGWDRPLFRAAERMVAGEALLLFTDEADWAGIQAFGVNSTRRRAEAAPTTAHRELLDVCSLTYVVAEDLPMSWQTMYHIPGLGGLAAEQRRRFLDPRLVTAEWGRRRRRGHPQPRCDQVEEVDGKDPLDLQQVLVPFVVFGALSGLAVASFALEVVLSWAVAFCRRFLPPPTDFARRISRLATANPVRF